MGIALETKKRAAIEVNRLAPSLAMAKRATHHSVVMHHFHMVVVCHMSL